MLVHVLFKKFILDTTPFWNVELQGGSFLFLKSSLNQWMETESGVCTCFAITVLPLDWVLLCTSFGLHVHEIIGVTVLTAAQLSTHTADTSHKGR